MGNIVKKAAALQAVLEQNGLLQKRAEKIEHIASPEKQGELGNTMQKEIEQGADGDYASAKGAAPIGAAELPDLILGDSKTPAKADLRASGTTINQINTAGDPQGTPEQVVNKIASLKQKLNACARAEIQKHAAYQQQQAQNNFVTASSVMHKIASLSQVQGQQQAAALAQDIDADFYKLANFNPLFGPACENVAFRKMAALIESLAAAEGIPEEQAAAALDASMANDPAAQLEFNNEVEGLALSDLANAEQDTEALLAGLDDTAAKVSEVTGELVTAEDLINAVDEVVAQADELGVEPEVLIQAAALQMAGAQDVSPEDEAMAQQLVLEAAANGVSPEELVAALSEDASAAPEEVPADDQGGAEESCDDGECQKKEAAFHKQASLTLTKLASTKRGANLARILARR